MNSKIWIARDLSGEQFLYLNKPKFDCDTNCFFDENWEHSGYLTASNALYKPHIKKGECYEYTLSNETKVEVESE